MRKLCTSRVSNNHLLVCLNFRLFAFSISNVISIRNYR